MAQQFNIARIQRHFASVMLYAPGLLATHAVNFFLDRFNDEAWLDNYRQPWPARKLQTSWGKTKRPGRKLLVDKARLKRSIRPIYVRPMEAMIGTDVPYAKAHNEGMRLGEFSGGKRTGFTQSVKAFKRGNSLVKAHTRTINMTLPKRQFMGNSAYLNKQLSRILMAELMKGLRKY